MEGQEPGSAIVMLRLDCSVVIKSLNLLLTLIIWRISQKCIFVASNFKKRLREGLPWWLSGEESSCQCGRHEFDSSSRKIPHAMEPLCYNYRAYESLRAWESKPLSPRAATTELFEILWTAAHQASLSFTIS